MTDSSAVAFRQALTGGAALDALTYFASRATILEAVDSLERGEFGGWAADVQAEAANELRALAECYHPVAS